MTTPSSNVAFDARPLTDPVDPRAVTAFVAEMKARRATAGLNVGLVIGIIVGAVALFITVPIAIGAILSISSGALSTLAVVPFLFFAVIVGVIATVAVVTHRRSRVTRYRVSRFAQANNMVYEDGVDNPPLPGMIFQYGTGRRASMLVRGYSPRFVEFGNYQYTVKQGKNSTTYRWGYVAVRLDAPLPNIVLDAVGNNGFGSNLPASFDKDQRLSLEGDFDRYFTLYCPEGYERDALYLFTPDIMARFIDNAAELDVEIVDDWLFLYTRREASTLDPATWAWLFGAVGALITKLDQWARWRDERLVAQHGADAAASMSPASGSAAGLPFAAPSGQLTPPPGVAPSGRRLKRRSGWVWIVVAIAFFAISIWMRTT